MSKTSLTQQFRGMVQNGMPQIVVGDVTAESPLTIVLDDDNEIQLSEESLIIPASKRPLYQGEQYYLLSVRNNKIYYVLDMVDEYKHTYDRPKAKEVYEQYLKCKKCPYC